MSFGLILLLIVLAPIAWVLGWILLPVFLASLVFIAACFVWIFKLIISIPEAIFDEVKSLYNGGKGKR